MAKRRGLIEIGLCLSSRFATPFISPLPTRVITLDSGAAIHLYPTVKPSIPGPIQESIEAKITKEFSPTHLEVKNESHMHSGPAQESHFKVVIVSDMFEGKSPIQRHRLINASLRKELQTEIHALSIIAKTSNQWKAEGKQAVPPSPPCMGGSKADKQ